MRSYYEEVLADSPVAYLRLAEKSGTSALDSSGNGHTGTYSGSNYYQGYPGPLGDRTTAMWLDGTIPLPDGVVTVADHDDIDADTGSFTVEAWVRPDIGDDTTRYILQKQSGAGAGWFLYTYGLGCYLYVVDGDTDTAYSTVGTLTLDAWSHLVGVIDRASQRCLLYVNGTLTGAGQDTTAVGDLSNALNLGIGRVAAAASGMWAGRIAEVAIYQSALSSARILAHYLSAPHPGQLIVTVGGTTVVAQKRSVEIVDVANDQTNTARVRVKGATGREGQAVRITFGSSPSPTLLFAGTIQRKTTVQKAQHLQAWTDLECADAQERLKQRRVYADIVSTAANSAFATLAASYASGFATSGIDTAVASLTTQRFTGQPLDEAFSALARAINGVWYADENLNLRFFKAPEAGVTQPDTLTGSSTTFRQWQYERDLSQVRTRVTVFGAPIFTESDAFVGDPVVRIQPTSVFGSTSSSFGVLVNGRRELATIWGDTISSFTAVQTPAAIGANTLNAIGGMTAPAWYRIVKAGATAGQNEQFVKALQQAGTPYKTVYNIPATGVGAIVSSLETNDVVFYTPYLIVTSLTSLLPAGSPLIPYYETTDNAARSIVASLTGTDGIYEYVVDAPELTTGAAMRGRAEMELAYGKLVTERVSLVTEEPAFQSGRVLACSNVSSELISGTFPIQRVTITFESGKLRPQRTVEAAATRRDLYDLLG